MATVDLDKGEGGRYHTLRVVCTCRDLPHNLDITVSNEWGHEIDVNLSEQLTLWKRIRAAFRVLMGWPLCLGGICVTDDDLKDIVKFIKKYSEKK
jgi:hypothetical protein